MKLINWAKQAYAFCFHRCHGCGSRLQSGQTSCSAECAAEEAKMQAIDGA